jgi:hypothetical protein
MSGCNSLNIALTAVKFPVSHLKSLIGDLPTVTMLLPVDFRAGTNTEPSKPDAPIVTIFILKNPA